MSYRRLVLFIVLTASTAMAAGSKESGTTLLKDVQPVGSTQKDHKQQYDFLFVSAGKEYSCRTNPKTSVKATDFVVGSNINYELKGDKAKLKSSTGKQLECTVVRVSTVSPAAN